MSLLDKASLVQIPSGYKATKLYSVVPDSGAGDFTFARSSTGSRVGSDGLIETGVAIDTPRLDYSGGATCPTLLLEGQRTNLQTYSEDLTNGAWITSNASVNPNEITSPDGTLTADKVDYGTGSGFIRNGVTLGSATTFSIFIKYFDFQWIQIMTSGDVNHYANFDVQNGALGNVGSSTEAEIEDYGNGWYRIVAKFVSGTFAGQPRLYKISSGVRPWAGGDGDAGSYYMWGGQQEVGAFQTSYIPTTSSTVTRNADSGILTSASALIGQTEGTLYSEFDLTEENNFTLVEINLGNSTNNRILAYRSASYINVVVQAGGTIEINNSTLVTFLDTNKIAITYQANNFKIYLNGSLVKTYTSGSIPSSLDTVALQDPNLQGKKQGIKSLILFKEILSDTELAALTTI